MYVKMTVMDTLRKLVFHESIECNFSKPYNFTFKAHRIIIYKDLSFLASGEVWDERSI
jgi:hypothetical protein